MLLCSDEPVDTSPSWALLTWDRRQFILIICNVLWVISRFLFEVAINCYLLLDTIFYHVIRQQKGNGTY